MLKDLKKLIDESSIELDLTGYEHGFTGDCFITYCEYLDGSELFSDDYDKLNNDSEYIDELVNKQII